MNNIKWGEFVAVAFSGAIGGLLAWLTGLAAIAAGEHLTSLLAALIGGAIAAGVGIYLIANSDTSQLMKLIFFAALCGISWQAVLATGGTLVRKAIVQSAIDNSKDASKTLTGVEAGQKASDEKIKSVADRAAKVTDKLPSIESSELKSDARQTVTEAIKTLKIAAPNNPQAATAALGEIAKRADESGSTHVKGEAVAELKSIKDDQKFSEDDRKTAANTLELVTSMTDKK